MVGTGDFNDDGHSDILWQNASGQAAIWEMNGTNVISETAVGANPGPSWKVIGTGDFNDDGHSDILWQRTNGQAAIWEMNGTNVISETAVGANPGPRWKVIGTGDFNGDGHSDILWQRTSGQAAIWEMNGTNVQSARLQWAPTLGRVGSPSRRKDAVSKRRIVGLDCPIGGRGVDNVLGEDHPIIAFVAPVQLWCCRYGADSAAQFLPTKVTSGSFGRAAVPQARGFRQFGR